MQNKLFGILAAVLMLVSISLEASDQDYVKVTVKNGDGIHNLLLRFLLPATTAYERKFKELNKGKFRKDKGLLLGEDYNLPVRIVKLKGKSFKTVLAGYDSDKLLKIEEYNKSLFRKGRKPDNLKARKEIWIPALDYTEPDSKIDTEKPAKSERIEKIEKKDDHTDISDHSDKDDTPEILEKPAKTGKLYPTSRLFGEKVVKTDNSLAGCVYYLDPGHGGPDPGAVGYKNSFELHEDEYAYDITLRLAMKLMEHGATVYMTIHDMVDGIRDMQYLNNSSDEKYTDGTKITNYSNERLAKRTSVINNLYLKHKRTARIQRTVVIHVDSRITDKRIDIFFYYQPECEDGKDFAYTLLNTIKKKYDNVQPGRGYTGTVTDRNLYLLRKSLPVATYIELGNIQNPKDQIRLIEKDNRQAIANWLYLGLAEDSRLNAKSKKRHSDSD